MVKQGVYLGLKAGVAVLWIVVSAISALAFRPMMVFADSGLAVPEDHSDLAAEVPLYSQLENAGSEWTSCGPTSLAMALNYRRQGPTPREVIDYATGNVGQDGEPLYKPHDPARVFTSPQHLYEIAQHYGRPVQGWVTDGEGAQEVLRALLADDLPVIVDVTVAIAPNGSTAAHFVTVTGIDENGTVFLNDPYGEGRGGQRRAVAWEDFYWAWQNNRDGHLGGHGWWMVVDPAGQHPQMAAGGLAQGDERAAPEFAFSNEVLLIVADPLAFHADVGMCVVA